MAIPTEESGWQDPSVINAVFNETFFNTGSGELRQTIRATIKDICVEKSHDLDEADQAYLTAIICSKIGMFLTKELQ